MTSRADDETELVRERITDPAQVVLRPIVRAWFANGVVAPDAFKLNDADKADSNRLSIDRGAAITAEQSYLQRAAKIKERRDKEGKPYRPPVGVLALAVLEVESVQIKSASGDSTREPLTVWDDSMNEDRADSHGHIDYDDLPPSDKGAHELAAKTLVARARANGWKHGPIPE